MLCWPILRTTRRRASALKSQALGMLERRGASPSVREQRSMADTEEKKPKKAGKPGGETAGQPDKAGKAEKPPKAAKADKAEKAAEGKAKPEPREPEPKVPARLKVEFDE